MKIISNPTYDCILQHCPDCLEQPKKVFPWEVVIFLVVLLSGGLFYAWKMYELDKKSKETKKTMVNENTRERTPSEQ